MSKEKLQEKPEKKAKAKVHYGMVIDLRRCIGCHSCSVACKAEVESPPGVYRSWVKIIEKGTYPHVRKFFLPSLCNNCDHPICLTNCPVKATWKREDGIVVVDPHRCIGCKYCMASCPYDVRSINPLKRIVQKCEFCRHRVDAGIEPACVETCLGRARIFGNMLDPKSEISQLLATLPTQVIKPDLGTYPQVFYIEADLDAMNPMKGWKGEE